MSNYKWREVGFVGTALETVVALHNSQVDELQAEIARLRDELAAADERLALSEMLADTLWSECEASRKAIDLSRRSALHGYDPTHGEAADAAIKWDAARADTDAARKERGDA